MARERRDAAPGGDVPDPGRVVAGDAREAAVGEVRERVHPERVADQRRDAPSPITFFYMLVTL